MYRSSKFNLSRASLEFFSRRFNEISEHRNLEWRCVNNRPYTNDGYFVDLGIGKLFGYDWSIRDSYFNNGVFEFSTIRQFARQIDKPSVRLSLQCDRDCNAFIAVWHDDLRNGTQLVQKSRTDYGMQDENVYETEYFRVYRFEELESFKDMVSYAINNDIYDHRAFGTVVSTPQVICATINNGMFFHDINSTTCNYVCRNRRIHDGQVEARKIYGSKEEALSEGLVPCAFCFPPGEM